MAVMGECANEMVSKALILQTHMHMPHCTTLNCTVEINGVTHGHKVKQVHKCLQDQGRNVQQSLELFYAYLAIHS